MRISKLRTGYSKILEKFELVIRHDDDEYRNSSFNTWDILVYCSLTAIGVLLIYIYRDYIFNNKEKR